MIYVEDVNMDCSSCYSFVLDPKHALSNFGLRAHLSLNTGDIERVDLYCQHTRPVLLQEFLSGTLFLGNNQYREPRHRASHDTHRGLHIRTAYSSIASSVPYSFIHNNYQFTDRNYFPKPFWLPSKNRKILANPTLPKSV